MSMIIANPIEHLTVTQMAQKYPDQWLGLVNIKCKNNDGVTIESADVSYLDATRDELFHKQIHDKDVIAWYTTEDDFAMGMVGE